MDTIAAGPSDVLIARWPSSLPDVVHQFEGGQPGERRIVLPLDFSDHHLSAERSLQLRGRTFRNKAARRENPDPVRQFVCLLEVLGGQEDRHDRSAFRRRTSDQTVKRLCGSSPVVGSSKNSTSGSSTKDAARSNRRFMPPE